MSGDDTRGARISRALAGRGFSYKRRDLDRWYLFEGALHAEGAVYPVRLSVDPTGQALPRICLTPVPDCLKPIAPHISAQSNLCYSASGTITLDVFDPDGQVLACIERAELILGQILRGELTPDLDEEFFACWPSNGVCLLDIIADSKRPPHCIVLTVGEAGYVAQPAALRRLLKRGQCCSIVNVTRPEPVHMPLLPTREHVVIDEPDAAKVLRQHLLLGRCWIDAKTEGAFDGHDPFSAVLYTLEAISKSGTYAFSPAVQDGFPRLYG